MAVIRITREFRFESAHALKGYDGPCRNVHGHSYELAVTIAGTPEADQGSPKLGMVMDFGDLKRLIQSNIIDPLDHALILDSTQSDVIPAREPFANVVYVDFQPTSENLLLDFAARIKNLLPRGMKLHHLLLRETASSFAEWFAEDQKA
jgi:6-pyruvoyltetrahydropterin/6-carboxytetrahydropterin synthase